MNRPSGSHVDRCQVGRIGDRVTPDPSAEVCKAARPIDTEAVMKTKTKIAVSVRCRQRPTTTRRNTDQSTDSLAV